MQEGHMPVKRWLLSGFFLFMLACTGISRIYDSVTVPKVKTSTAKRKTVETIVEGSGTVKVKEKRIYPVFSGLRLAQAMVLPGSEVKAGDVLFQYDLGSIKEKKEVLWEELEQIEIHLEKERIAQETYSGMSQTELAQWELDLALREMGEGQAEMEEEWKKHDKELERLKQEYEEDLARTNDDLWQQQDRDQEQAKQELERAKNSRDREIRAAQRRVDELVEEMDLLAGEDEKERQKLERELQDERESLEALQAAWKEQIETAEARLERLEDQEERIHAGRTEAQESQRKNYEEALRQENEKIEEAQKGLKTLEKAIERAEQQLSKAQREDEAARLSKEHQQRISALTIREMELERKAKQRQLSRLEELERTEGKVLAAEDGIVTDMELIAGKTTSGEEIVSLAVGENQFEAVFFKEEQNLAKGDVIEISIPGTPKKKEAVIDRINLMGEEEGILQADLGGSELALGSVTSYSCRKQTDMFNQVIPLEGLRKDRKGYYCLVARARPAILGEEFRAERVEVQLLYRGSREAAIEGTIFAEDPIIVGENQSIGEGSRVRPDFAR